MSGYLLDTNVVSEVIRVVPNPSVYTFFVEQYDLWLSSVVIHELEYGVQRLAEGRRRTDLRANLSHLTTEYGNRILTLDRDGAELAARFRVDSERSGYALGLADALIAGIAKANDLIVATRNVSDFRSIDIEVFNPWEIC